MTCKGAEHGWKEGLARTMSQACTYVVDVQKSLVQIHGKNHVFSVPQMINAFQQGVLQSSLTAGIVYGTYFQVYKSCNGEPYANALATFVTSVIKIPISNCMRLIQLHPKDKLNIITSGKRILRNQGARGLYSGYMLSYVEDFIEMELREKLFQAFDKWCVENRIPIHSHQIGFIGGALSGSSVAFLTTPFDALRCHMAYEAGTTMHRRVNLVHTVCTIFSQQGCYAFYRGANLRAMSTGLRMALFYMFVKIL